MGRRALPRLDPRERVVTVSIAMCTYNGSLFLSEQLASLMAQERLPDELVVCDDCSSDNTVDILREFAEDAPFPVLIHENKIRLKSTKNFEQAIALCQGDLILLCDQDDIWDTQKVSLTEQCFKKNERVSLVFSDAEVVGEDGSPLGYTLWESLRLDQDLQARIKTSEAFEILNFRPLVTGSTMGFRKEFRDLVLPIPGGITLIHDGWIALMISLTGVLDLIDRTLMKYRQHPRQQLGAPENNRANPDAGFMANAQRRNGYETEIEKLEAVRERVRSQGSRYHFNPKIDLDGRLKHLQQRLTISELRLKRIPMVFEELVTGRYHRYSNGLYSLFKDLAQ